MVAVPSPAAASVQRFSFPLHYFACFPAFNTVRWRMCNSHVLLIVLVFEYILFASWVNNTLVFYFDLKPDNFHSIFVFIWFFETFTISNWSIYAKKERKEEETTLIQWIFCTSWARWTCIFVCLAQSRGRASNIPCTLTQLYHCLNFVNDKIYFSSNISNSFSQHYAIFEYFFI